MVPICCEALFYAALKAECMSTCDTANCRCVGPTFIDRCVAIREYVRPDDVAHLIRVVPRWALQPGHSRAGEIARWLRDSFALGELRYIPDPIDCDRWGRPAETFRRGGGDCDDLAILVASLCRAMGVRMHVVVGTACTGKECDGHAWVEGIDEVGPFFIEPTSGALRRKSMPEGYTRYLLLTPEVCRVALEASNRKMQIAAANVNAAVSSARQDALLRQMFGIAS
jgi:hypothetical protein